MKKMCSVFIIAVTFSIGTTADIYKENVSGNLDSICKVWIKFKDKPESRKPQVSLHTFARRTKVGYIENESDLPVSEAYIKKIESYGAKLRYVFKWENSASFTISSRKLKKVASLSIVNEITPVRNFRIPIKTSIEPLQKRMAAKGDSLYGASYDQLNIANIPAAHDYLQNTRSFSAPGEGVIIAFFDTGFRLEHKSLQNVKNGHIKACYDFIDNDTSVADPDSVKNSTNHPYYKNDEHGSQTLSLIAGYDPGKFMGVAWGAQFVLARTEDAYYDSITGQEREIHGEEDCWAAAICWAESLGVDIVSSSLGYRDEFQDTVTIINGDSTRKIRNYNYEDLDGKTTIVSRAALAAVQRGMIIVNAIGNEGIEPEGTLSAPADVEGVISVGALNSQGTAIADYSSSGPTADGRIKPDLVTRGSLICIPDVYGELTNYKTSSGTSFSTPIIAGICALIMQSMQDRSSEKVKDVLYNSCTLLSGQTTIDNKYGRGIPNALAACKSVAEKNAIANQKGKASAITFNIFPNVLRSGMLNKVNFSFHSDDKYDEVNLMVFSADGVLLWRKNLKSNKDGVVTYVWECKNRNGSPLAPGNYFAVFRYKNGVYQKRMIIVG